ncbi:MAG: VWA domain-containing protein [Desulfobacterales bacterium]|nr:VWA domain-containing protein [Desulfobacterales bacterium]
MFFELRFDWLNLGAALTVMLIMVPTMLWFHYRKGKTARVRFSSLKNIKAARPGLKVRLRSLPVWLRVLGVCLLLTAFAHPYQEKELFPEKDQELGRVEKKGKKKEERKKIQVPTEGIAIQLLIDRSGSMGIHRSQWGNRVNYIRFEKALMSKLDAVKIVSRRFIQGTEKTRKKDSIFTGRGNDMIGLFTFARRPFIACPLTLRHELLLDYMNQMDIVRLQEEDGTYIGYALQRAILHIIDAKSRAGESDPYNIKSTIIILVTDGEQVVRPEDANDRDKSLLPSEAARLAKDNDIKIYSVAIWPRNILDENGTVVQRNRGFSSDEIRKAAEITGGKFYSTRDVGALTKIYQEIDKLEKSKIPTKKELEVKVEKSKEIQKRETEKVELFQPFLWAGFLLLLLEIFLSELYFRRIP